MIFFARHHRSRCALLGNRTSKKFVENPTKKISESGSYRTKQHKVREAVDFKMKAKYNGRTDGQ